MNNGGRKSAVDMRQMSRSMNSELIQRNFGHSLGVLIQLKDLL